MPDTPSLQRGALGIGRPLLLTILALYLLDQVSKWWIVFNFEPYGRDKITLIDNFLNIIRVHNTGVAFGFGNGTAWSTYLFLLIPIVALVVILYLFRKGKFFTTPLLRFIGALIIAGVIGNLTDRLFQGFFLPGAENLNFFQNLSNGYVVDFIDVIVPFTNNWHWPCFNVADACITSAAVLLFITSFFSPKAEEKA